MPQAQVSSLRQALAMRRIAPPTSLRQLCERYGLRAKDGLHGLLRKLSNFRIVVIGDSVIWGQGLLHSQKTFSLLANKITSEAAGLSVIVSNYSHSGAIMGTLDQRTNATTKNGEVPFDFPTLFGQLDMTADGRDEYTDLIILNGGINDVGFTTIIDPVSDISEEKLRRDTRANCHTRMAALIIEAHNKHPNAQIIVTGYYRILSLESSILLYAALLSLLGAFPSLPTVAVIPALFLISVKRCDVFYEISQQALRDAVADANPSVGGRAAFAEGDWSIQHSLFAPKSNLFQFAFDLDRFDAKDANPLTVVLEDDPSVAASRMRACLADAGDFKCPIASIGHPNTQGAVRNLNAIVSHLRPI